MIASSFICFHACAYVAHDHLNDAQLNVLEPPHANWLDSYAMLDNHDNDNDDDDQQKHVEIVSRSKEKKDHGKVVFSAACF